MGIVAVTTFSFNNNFNDVSLLFIKNEILIELFSSSFSTLSISYDCAFVDNELVILPYQSTVIFLVTDISAVSPFESTYVPVNVTLFTLE